MGNSLYSLISDDPRTVACWDFGGFPDFARDREPSRLHGQYQWTVSRQRQS